MIEVPADAPDMMPVRPPAVATLMLPLDHVPPPTMSERVVLLPAHIDGLPVIGARAFTVIVVVR